MDPRPVLYLDLDDTIVSWADGSPRPVPATREFLSWALERFEVRWLTRWAPEGRMSSELLRDLAKLTGIDVDALEPIRGVDWSAAGSKLNGIAWLEHVVLGRPFVWLEDESASEHLAALAHAGWESAYLHCNCSRHPERLLEVRQELETRFFGTEGDASRASAA